MQMAYTKMDYVSPLSTLQKLRQSVLDQSSAILHRYAI